MSRPDLMGLAEQERASLLDLLSGLTDEQWAAPSLCSRWTVRDVAVHVVSYDELSKPALVSTFVRGGVRIDSVNDVALRRYADLEPAEIIDLVGRCRKPRGITAGFRGAIALTDGTIHQQDIRRALGLPRAIPADQLLLVSRDGPQIQQAQATLESLAKIPASDLALLQQASKAAEESPKQWQHYFWIAVGGQIVFLPMIFLMAGYWSPRRARAKEQEHEAFVEEELAKLGSS